MAKQGKYAGGYAIGLRDILMGLVGIVMVGCLVTMLLPERTPEQPKQTDPVVQVGGSLETEPAAPSTQPPEPTTLVTEPPVEPWKIALVNAEHRSDPDYAPVLKQLRYSQSVDERCYPELQKMMDGCRSAGYEPRIISSYRSYQAQEKLYQEKVEELLAQGHNQVTAETLAGQVVAIPGTSEHHLGLAVDIIDETYWQLDEKQAQTGVQQWLMKYCWDYGFILRYPEGKSDWTGIVYEPWHYRYVGREVALELRDREICLEEYLAERNGE